MRGDSLRGPFSAGHILQRVGASALVLEQCLAPDIVDRQLALRAAA
jgi:hypothetical protein